MMNEMGLRRTLHDHSSGSGQSFGTIRHPSIIDPILSKRVCFYKSGDPQFNGLRMVINNRSFKTFDALLDSLSKKVPLPFGVRNITTPRGVHAIYTLDELEDGKSYICSDSRKVKPINLSLARKKLPPWYHARPVSSRRRTVQQARLFPGQNLHKKEPVVVCTPKRLLVFRNGVPTVKHTVVLHKRNTSTFESILEYISELLQFYVLKLHTPDGRRVDGLPGLILCSGIVVAAGREPFRPANYNALKSPPTAILPTSAMGHRRLKAFNRKKKFQSHTSKSRKFSPSSERYIVNRIHDSIAESSCDLPSNPTNSIELDTGCMLESVAETEGDACPGNCTEGQDCLLPTEDDIEKSFRVNQDGSMTVEMKVRLTIKEEETIHWTTTLSRSSVANQLNADCLPEPEAEQEISSLKSMDLQSPAASIDTIKKDKTKDNNDEDPPSMGNEAFSENSNEEDDSKIQIDMMPQRRVPTPGHKQIRKKQASVESIKSLTAEGIQEDMIGAYSYREQTERGVMTEKYCMVKQSSTKPVPKPRRLGSVDVNNINCKNVSTFNSAGLTEILQIESSGEEVTETVLHIYEQQTCQDNFLANLCAEGTSASGISFCRPATSGTGQLCYNNEFEPQLWRPSTASESVSIWRAESLSVTSDLTLPSLKTGAIPATNAQQQFPQPTKGKEKPQQRVVNEDKRVSLKPKVINKRVRRLMTPGRRQKESSAGATEKRKKAKTFSSAGFIKKIYGNKSKSPKSMIKLKKGPTQNGEGSVTTKVLQQSDSTTKCSLKDPNIPSALKENTSETVSLERIMLNVAPNEVSQPRGILTRQTSMHQEKKNENESFHVSESMSLPAFNSSSSVTNEYVENWLEKAHLNPTTYIDEEHKKIEDLVQTGNGRCEESENRNGLMSVAKQIKAETSEIQSCLPLKTDFVPEIVQEASVKQRIQSFENKSSSPSMEKTTVNHYIVSSLTTTSKTENYNGITQNNIQEIKPLSHHYCSEIVLPTNKTSTEMPPDSEIENKSNSIKVSFQKATLSKTLSVELPLPPPPEEHMELPNNEYCMMDVTSVASSPLYRLSSVCSQMSDNHPLSTSPTSDNAISPTNTMEMTTSIQSDIPSTLGEAPLQRTQSVKRAPLVSNLSLDRKMSLRKACLDKYTLCSDATSGTTTSSTPFNIVGENVLPNGICSTGTRLNETPHEETQQSHIILKLTNSPSCCTSASPTSLTSEEGMSSSSIMSSEAPTPHNLPFKETKPNKAPLLSKKEASSPKPLVKKVKNMGSPSPERKSNTKKVSSELPQMPLGIQKHATSKASPSTERKRMLHKPKLQKRLSPYSQSLDIVSPPVRHKSSNKTLSRNLSSDNASEVTPKTQRKTSLERKHQQATKSRKSTAELDETLTCNTLVPLEAEKSNTNKVNKTDDLTTADQERSVAETQIMPQPFSIANQPNIKPVLEEICYSIKSIRQITQNKSSSCLKKSNSLPDFSSHVASTFGSSSKALLAFLSVMTLKDGITNLNMDELNANNVSCAEALRMISSLREIANIEDSHKLKASLSNLQQSASEQLLQNWKGFQELSDKCKSRSSTPNDSNQELVTMGSLLIDTDESAIDEIMDTFDIPEKLREELASLSVVYKNDSDEKQKMSARIIEKVELSPRFCSNAEISHSSTEDVVRVSNVTKDEKPKIDVNAIIKKFSDINQPKQSSTEEKHSRKETVKHKATDEATGDKDSKYGKTSVCPPAEPNDELMNEERRLYSTISCVKENGDRMPSQRDSVNQEKQGEKDRHQGCDEDKSNKENAKMNGVISSTKNQNSSTSLEGKDMDGYEHVHDNESGAEEEGQDVSSEHTDLEQKVSCGENVSRSEAGEQHSSEEDPDDESEERQQEIMKSDALSNTESHSEEEEDKQPSANYYVELNAREEGIISSPDSQNRSSSEEEQPEVECTELSSKNTLPNSASPANSEKEEQSQAGSKGPNASVDESACISDLDEPSSEDEQPEVDCTELSNKDSLSKPTSPANSDKEQQSQEGSIGQNVSIDESACTSDLDEPSSEEEQPEVECAELSNKDFLSKPTSPANSEKEEQSQEGSMGLNVSVDESAFSSDLDEPSSEEEQPEVDCKEPKIIIEEDLSDNEEEHKSMEEEEHLDDHLDQTQKGKELKALIEEEREDDKVSSDDEDHHADNRQMCDKTKSQDPSEGDLSNLLENQDSFTKNSNISLIKSDNLTITHYRFNADKDSGNEHSSSEEHSELEQTKVEVEGISSSNEDELSYYEKEFSSEEEHVNIGAYIQENFAKYQQAPALETQFEVTKSDKSVEKVNRPSDEIIPQSITERVLLLEKQVADAQGRKNSTERSPMRCLSQRNVPLESNVEESRSDLPRPESTFGTRSAPQSSLSFSYDSSGIITTQPESNRVRLIREMFLAKTATDSRYGHRPFSSQHTSELSQFRAETSASGGYQSQNSSELSSGEDDSARKSITKGFVRRTIERLYGKKDSDPDEETSERPPSAPKQKKKEHSGIFSPFHIARSKAISELSYFNSTNALDTFSEAARCVAFNSQVGPGDSVPIDKEHWLLRENTLIRKSVSDPAGINKAFTNSPQGESVCEDTEENTPYSLFSSKSELEDKKSFSRKCTYFSLPHASDSDTCQDDLSTVSKGTGNGDSVIDTKDNSENTKLSAGRNGTLPGIGVTDFKIMDNKVHPLIELPRDGEVVAAQPLKGQGVMNRRLQEPDMLDLLYDFCGQNCPIL